MVVSANKYQKAVPNKAISKAAIIFSCVFSIACQQHSRVELIETKNIESEAGSEKRSPMLPLKKQQHLAEKQCDKQATPPLKNRDKIESMLLSQNKITKDMSPTEIDEFVDQYISSKYIAVHCRKLSKQ